LKKAVENSVMHQGNVLRAISHHPLGGWCLHVETVDTSLVSLWTVSDRIHLKYNLEMTKVWIKRPTRDGKNLVHA